MSKPTVTISTGHLLLGWGPQMEFEFEFDPTASRQVMMIRMAAENVAKTLLDLHKEGRHGEAGHLCMKMCAEAGDSEEEQFETAEIITTAYAMVRAMAATVQQPGFRERAVALIDDMIAQAPRVQREATQLYEDIERQADARHGLDLVERNRLALERAELL